MKIQVLYDNRNENEILQHGWGFSCLIDLGPRKILFDTGADQNALFSNMQKLGIEFDAITDVVYSHKHSDHIAGFREVLEKLKKGSRLFLPKGFPAKKIPAHIQVQTVADYIEIDTQVHSLVLRGGFFLYEQALILQTEKGLVIVTGCAHPGITNLIEAVKKRLQQPIHLVLGGFHLFRKNSEFVGDIVDKFKSLQVEKAAPCHCSGDAAIAQFQEAYQDRFYKIGTGTVLTLD